MAVTPGVVPANLTDPLHPQYGVRHAFEMERGVFTEDGNIQEIQCWLINTTGPTVVSISLVGANDGSTVLYNAAGYPMNGQLPLPWSEHPVIPGLWGTNYQIERMPTSPTLHRALITYAIPKYKPAPGGGGGPAVKWDLDIGIGGRETKEHTNFAISSDDNAGNVEWNTPIINSAGVQSTSTLPRSYCDEEITLSFSTYTVDQSNIGLCRETTNFDTVSINIDGYSRTFDPYTLYLERISQSSSLNLFNTNLTTTQNYWKMGYTLLYRKGGWNVQIVDQSSHIVVARSGYSGASGYMLVPTPAGGSNARGTMQYLNGNGEILGYSGYSGTCVLVPPFGISGASGYSGTAVDQWGRDIVSLISVPNGLPGYQMIPSTYFGANGMVGTSGYNPGLFAGLNPVGGARGSPNEQKCCFPDSLVICKPKVAPQVLG